MSNIKHNKEGFDYLAKIAIIGDSSVGKTNMLLRYISGDYHMSHLVTIGIDFKIKTITLSNNFKMKLQIWDTAGQERFRNLSGTIYQGASAIILAYSIASRKSFDDVKNWVQDIQNKVKDTKFVFAIIGNKCDLQEQRQVTRQQGMQIAKKYGAKIFMETSAKQNINVDQLFQRVGQKVKDNLSQKDIKPKLEQKKQRSKSTADNESMKDSKIKLSKENKKQKKGCC